jgi:hypothetical protein
LQDDVFKKEFFDNKPILVNQVDVCKYLKIPEKLLNPVMVYEDCKSC